MIRMNRMIRVLLAVLPFASVVAVADVKLPAVIGDSMVLQRGGEVAIWGWADAGEEVKVRGSWSRLFDGEKKTVADADGKWQVMLKTSGAGGPYTVTITGNNEIVLKDILVGEVWVCSGQSNMEWPMGRVDNAEAEIAVADYPKIRLFTVAKNINPTPVEDCTGSWAACTPESVQLFSAVGYYFGKKLQEELKVPVGLINTSWGGTVAESWTKREVIEEFGEFDDKLKAIDDELEKGIPTDAEFAQQIKEWQEGADALDVGVGESWHGEVFDDSAWGDMETPKSWDSEELKGFDGIVWNRKTIEIPAAWNGKELVVELGWIDDEDITWFNGKEIGRTANWKAVRKYAVPADLVKEGKNIIAVKTIDNGGGGGFHSAPDAMKIYPKGKKDKAISLAGTWKYKVSVNIKKLPPKPLKTPLHVNMPTMLYNGMISPLVPYGIKGAIWYQGESNIGRDEQYSRLFPAMIQNWRDDWGRGDFPFYYVQIAPFVYGNLDAPASAFLREAQMQTLAYKNVGMAVTMDIANVYNIHPRNKLDVGNRLALWALAKDYGRTELAYSGPIYKSKLVEGGKIRLKFDYVNGGLVAKDGELTHFAIAGYDEKFVPAKAVIDGDTIVVSSEDVPVPVAVRYGFTNSAEPNLFNKAGLPASSFRTDSW